MIIPRNPNTKNRCSHASAVRIMRGTPVEWCGVCGAMRLTKSKVCRKTNWLPPGLGRRVIREILDKAGFYTKVKVSA